MSRRSAGASHNAFLDPPRRSVKCLFLLAFSHFPGRTRRGGVAAVSLRRPTTRESASRQAKPPSRPFGVTYLRQLPSEERLWQNDKPVYQLTLPTGPNVPNGPAGMP